MKFSKSIVLSLFLALLWVQPIQAADLEIKDLTDFTAATAVDDKIVVQNTINNNGFTTLDEIFALVEDLTDLTLTTAFTDQIPLQTTAGVTGFTTPAAILGLLSAEYGELRIADGAASQVFTTSASQVTLWAINGPSQNMTVDHTLDTIVVGSTSIHIIAGQLSFSDGNNTMFECHIRVNNIEQDAGFHRKMSSSGDVGSASLLSLIALTSGDAISLWCETDSVPGQSMVGIDAQLTVIRLR